MATNASTAWRPSERSEIACLTLFGDSTIISDPRLNTTAHPISRDPPQGNRHGKGNCRSEYVDPKRNSPILDTRELTVSFSSSLDTKEQVREAIDIVDLVGKYVQLRRQGRNYVGLCPWHDDSHPSFQVSPERQSFKCWVCDIGGDVFSFVMRMEGVEFREALEMLADQAGIELKPLRPARPTPAAKPEDGEDPGVPPEATDYAGSPPVDLTSGEGKRSLFRAMAWVEAQFHDCLLNDPQGEPARKYLDERGITAQSIEEFHLGFSPNEPDWIFRRAKATESRARVLETIGVLARSQEGKLYDRFRGRLLFSIRDPQDRPVGLGGRILPESGLTSRAKYVNSPETPLFSKSKLLYGLDFARHAMRKSRQALILEGYTDCIIAHQHGFQDAVAVLGTALTEQHVRILKRFADRIVLVLDGDEAGRRRANEVLELFVTKEVDLRVVTLPEGQDPADFLQEHGPEAFGDLLASRAVDGLEHAYQSKTHGVDLENDVHGATRALDEIVSILAKAPRLTDATTHGHRLREQKMLERLAVKFRVPEGMVRDRLTELRRASRRRPSATVAEAAGPQVDDPEAAIEPDKEAHAWERGLLEILICHPQLVPTARAEIGGEQFARGPSRRIYEACCRLSDTETGPGFERLMLEFDDSSIKSLLVDLEEEGRNKAVTDPETLLEELLKRRKTQLGDPARMAAFRDEGLDESQKDEMLEELARDLRARHGISDPTEG